ncbi:MAG: hypothetical protein GX055_00245, partial [Desulfovibrionales bacterium]|nr:hypothetical protein [Desulfovibrionales bacterium]
MAPESLLLLGADPAWQAQVQAVAPELGHTVSAPCLNLEAILSELAVHTWTMLLVEGQAWTQNPALCEAAEHADVAVVLVGNDQENQSEDLCVLATPLNL